MTDRQTASQLGRKLLKGQITFQEFSEDFPDNEVDKDIFLLYDLIEHKPAVKGFFGIEVERHHAYVNEIYELIYELDPPPATIGGARTRYYLDIDGRFTKTNNTQHFNNTSEIKGISCLAICKYDNDPGFYLFGCDENWNTKTDTYHESVADAKDQAEFEYAGTLSDWRAI